MPWLVVAIALFVLAPELDRDVYGLESELIASMESGNRETFHESLARAVELHPAEPSFALLAGSEASRFGEPGALAWLNRAMVMAPGWDAPHTETARYLFARGRIRQALLELREAEARRYGAGGFACQILQQREAAAADLIAVAPRNEAGDRWLDSVATCLPLESAAATALDRALTDRGVLGASLRRARRQLRSEEPAAALRTLQAVEAQTPRVTLLRAQSLLEAGEAEEAVALLSEAGRWPDHAEAGLRTRARAEAAAGDLSAMRSTLEAVRGRAAGRPLPLASARIFEGRLEAAAGNRGRAMRAYERAQRLDPRAGALPLIASLAEQMGDPGRALRAYAEICRRDGSASPACTASERLRAEGSNEPLGSLEQLPGAP